MERVNQLQHSRCLHKGVITEDYVIIFGGIEASRTEILDRETFNKVDNKSTDSLVECL